MYARHDIVKLSSQSFHNLKTSLLFCIAIGFLSISLLFGCAPPDGAKLFDKEGCRACHRFKGKGGSICPDLTDVKSRRSDEWIRQQLKDSSVNDPDSTMQSFDHLSDKEIQAIIDYLKS